MNLSITLKTGQTHVHRYMTPLLKKVENGEIDPGFIVSHHLGLEDAPEGYEMFNKRRNECIKVVLKPNWQAAA